LRGVGVPGRCVAQLPRQGRRLLPAMRPAPAFALVSARVCATPYLVSTSVSNTLYFQHECMQLAVVSARACMQDAVVSARVCTTPYRVSTSASNNLSCQHRCVLNTLSCPHECIQHTSWTAEGGARPSVKVSKSAFQTLYCPYECFQHPVVSGQVFPNQCRVRTSVFNTLQWLRRPTSWTAEGDA